MIPNRWGDWTDEGRFLAETTEEIFDSSVGQNKSFTGKNEFFLIIKMSFKKYKKDIKNAGLLFLINT